MRADRVVDQPRDRACASGVRRGAASLAWTASKRVAQASLNRRLRRCRSPPELRREAASRGSVIVKSGLLGSASTDSGVWFASRRRVGGRRDRRSPARQTAGTGQAPRRQRRRDAPAAEADRSSNSAAGSPATSTISGSCRIAAQPVEDRRRRVGGAIGRELLGRGHAGRRRLRRRGAHLARIHARQQIGRRAARSNGRARISRPRGRMMRRSAADVIAGCTRLSASV